MPTPGENLATAIANLTAEIASASASQKAFFIMPSGPDGQGREVSAVEYLESLNRRLEKLIELRQSLDGAFTLRTFGRATY